MNTNKDLVDYVYDNNKSLQFLGTMSKHTNGFSIGEITEYVNVEWVSEDKVLVSAKVDNSDDSIDNLQRKFAINKEIDNINVVSAVAYGKYMSVFLIREDDYWDDSCSYDSYDEYTEYQIKFLIFDFLEEEKHLHEEEISESVVKFMIQETISKLNLTTIEDIEDFI